MEDRNKYLREALDMARDLTLLADQGEARSVDDGCMVLFSIVRDCAYRIRARAEQERDVHKLLGFWESSTPVAASSASSADILNLTDKGGEK